MEGERCPHFRGWYVQASMELGPEDVSLLERCPHFRGWYVEASMELGPEDVSLLERCPHFRGWYVEASMELEPEDVSLLERCPHFRGWYVQASMELGPEDVSLLERCPHFRGWYVQASMELGPEDVSLLERCPHFTHSYNGIHNIALLQLGQIPSLRALFLQGKSHDSQVMSCDSHMTSPGNEISRVDGLTGLSNLTELVLDGNRIKVTSELNVAGMHLFVYLCRRFMKGLFQAWHNYVF